MACRADNAECQSPAAPRSVERSQRLCLPRDGQVVDAVAHETHRTRRPLCPVSLTMAGAGDRGLRSTIKSVDDFFDQGVVGRARR